MPVNKNEAPNGYRAQKSDGSCIGCAFYEDGEGCRDITIPCSMTERTDRNEVILIEKEGE